MISTLPLLISAALLAGTPSPLGTKQGFEPNTTTSVISGNMTVVKGTLVDALTPSNTIQTVKVMVGSTMTTVTGCLVVGSPTTAIYTYPAGAPVAILKAGSAPFISAFTATSVGADMPGQLSPGQSRRTVPMSASGVLTDSIVFPYQTPGAASLSLLYPPSSNGGFTFNNGVTMSIGSFPASYSINLPTTATSPVATVLFPTTDYGPYQFSFLARGGKSNFAIQGQGTNRNLNIVSTIDVAGSVFQTAQFTIYSNYIY